MEAIGAAIREWRTSRGLSQMELALNVDISPRHLSFVETGRSRPSAELLLALAESLNVPLRARNGWLLAAGYAPRYSEAGLDATHMAFVKAAVQRLLDTHHPYPGVALDRHWNVVLQNGAAAGLLSLLPPHLREGQVNIFRASLHPDGFAAHTKNFAEWGSYLLQLLDRLVLDARDEALMALAAEVRAYPNVRALDGKAPEPQQPVLLVPCILDMGGRELSLFTTLTTFGSPRDITLHELCVELFYPADAETEAFLRSA